MIKIKRYQLGLIRLWRQWQCQKAYERSPKPLADTGNTYVILFFDYEGKYSPVLEASEQDEFSCKGIDFILEELRQVGFHATFNCVGQLMVNHPDKLKRIAEDGHEIASHTVNHTPVNRWTPNRMSDDMHNFRELLRPITSSITGFRGPQSKWHPRSLQGLLQAGVLWNAEDDAVPSPYIIAKKGEQQLWRMPITIDDWAMEGRGVKPEVMEIQWRNAVKSAIEQQRYVAVGFHPWVLGRDEARLAAFSTFIHWLANLNEVDVDTFGSLAEYCRTHTSAVRH